jgi:hypothetical protein
VEAERLLTIEGGDARLSLNTRVMSVTLVYTSTTYDVAPVTSPQPIDALEVLGIEERLPGATGTATGVLKLDVVHTPAPPKLTAWTLQPYDVPGASPPVVDVGEVTLSRDRRETKLAS